MKLRLAALSSVAALVLTLLVVTAPAANAAWFTYYREHGAKVQVCKIRNQADNSYTLKVRVDNRSASHAHTASLARTRRGEFAEVVVRAAAGRISSAKSLGYRVGDGLDWGFGEGNGISLGDIAFISDFPRC